MNNTLIITLIAFLFVLTAVYLIKANKQRRIFKSLKPGDKIRVMVYCTEHDCVVKATVQKVVGKDVFITYIKDKDYLCKNTNCHFPVVSMWDIIGRVDQ